MNVGGAGKVFFFFFYIRIFVAVLREQWFLLNLFLLKYNLHIVKHSLKIYSSMNFDTYTVTVISLPSQSNRDYFIHYVFFLWWPRPVTWGDGQTIAWRGNEGNRTGDSALPKFREATQPLPLPALFPPGGKISVNILRKLSSWSPRFEKMYCGLQKHPLAN